MDPIVKEKLGILLNTIFGKEMKDSIVTILLNHQVRLSNLIMNAHGLNYSGKDDDKWLRSILRKISIS